MFVIEPPFFTLRRLSSSFPWTETSKILKINSNKFWNLWNKSAIVDKVGRKALKENHWENLQKESRETCMETRGMLRKASRNYNIVRTNNFSLQHKFQKSIKGRERYGSDIN